MCVCAPRMSLFFSGRASCTRSGWRKSAVARGRALSGNSDCICNCVTEPRRADARRSCKRAFVYRTSRSFAGKCPHRRTTKSGGRKPPMVTINANATAIRTPSAVRRTIALVSAQTCFPHPRRADARRSWLHTRLRLPIGVSDLQQSYVTHGGLTPAAPVECAYVHRECRFLGESGFLAVCQSPKVARWAMLMAKAAAPITPAEPATTQCRHDGLR
jgi:hypothetical protein